MPIEYHVRNQLAPLAQHHMRPHRTPRPHRARLRNHSPRSNYGRWMNAHSAFTDSFTDSATDPPAASCARDTSAHITVASHASFPSTVALPSIFATRGLHVRPLP